MKKIFCLFLSIYLIYLAGMYRYLALMVLAVGQMLLVVFSAVQVYSCRRKVQAGFGKSIMAVEKDETLFKEGWEREFPRIVSEEFPQIEEELLRRQQEIVKEAAYGPEKANAADEQFVRWVYILLAEEVFRRMKGYRRMLFRYWKKFG